MTKTCEIAARFGAGERGPDQPWHQAMDRYLAAYERAKRAKRGDVIKSRIRLEDALHERLRAETVPFLPLPKRNRNNVTA
jgi:hypothetical protein